MDTESHLLLFVAAGFVAGLIDGVLGMGYGVSLTSLLLAIGIPPAAASASVHASEIFTSGVSGVSHLSFKNVDLSLLRRLVVPGVIGGVTGAYILTELPVSIIKPVIAVYLMAVGAVIVARAIRNRQRAESKPRFVGPLALVGGFLDAVGGGGWGPVVTTQLVAAGVSPRKAIGSVNLAEFFVTLAESLTFVLTIGLTNGRIILGLIIGGVLAAPLGAFLCKRLPARPWSLAVGVVIIVLSLRTLYLALA